MNETSEFEESLGHTFSRPELLQVALIHRSYSNEICEGPNNERLEFLGDSVVGLFAALWVFENHPECPEGELAKLKSFLVSTPSLSRRAEDLGIGPRMTFGVGEERSGGAKKPSILADALEAVIGAIFLDAGLDAVRKVMVPLFEKSLAERANVIPADAKTYLQELVQARNWGLPDYRLVKQSGPDHSKFFHVECWIHGTCAGVGEERSKKKAQQIAAAQAIEWIQALPNP